MMRKIFGSTMLLSITGAIILGGAFAWTNSKTSGEETINIGSVTWNLHYEQEPGVYLGPNDGELRVVGDGWIDNDSHSNFALRITGGAVNIDHVLPNVCGVASYFGGDVKSQDTGGNQVLNPGQTGNPDEVTGITAGRYNVRMSLASNTPDNCAGAQVAYTVRVDVNTAIQSTGN